MKNKTFDTPEHFNDEGLDSRLRGGFLLLMGAIFFLAASGTTIFGRSPLMLIPLLPAYWIYMTAYRCYREDGRLTRRVLSLLLCGLLPFIYMAAAFAGLNVGALWPLGLIVAGAALLFFGNMK